jgi:signal transduction histidine kinase/ligand-binding sensor domain-containing protein/DNA-binding response OmpR family regulator
MPLPVVAYDYMFKHLEVSDGLSNNQINAILKDSEGYLWFGTASGLVRYDGYQFKTFRSHDNDPTSLPDNYIVRITEDGQGHLWMRTGEGNYTLYDSRTESFTHDMRAWMWNIGIDGVPNEVLVDAEKNIWFYVEDKGCYYYRVAEGKVRSITFAGEALPAGSITGLAECSDGLLAVYDDGRVLCIEPDGMTVKWTLNKITDELKGVYETFSLFVDHDSDLWIYGAPGVWVYNLKSGRWQSKWDLQLRNGQHNMVRVLEQDNRGNIWIGKDQDGISVLNKVTGEITQLVYNPNDERSLPNNTISALYEDNNGVMWVGTYKRGVAYSDESIYKFGIDHVGDINCIEEDTDGSLWLGTNDTGLLRWNPVTNHMQTYAYSGNNGSVSSNVIVTLLKAKNGLLWIGTFWEGLNCFDGQRFIHYRAEADNPNSLANNNVWALVEDGAGNLWIGTLGGGLQCFNPRTRTFTTYNMSNSEIASNHISSLCVTRDNLLVIGTSSSGVSLFNLSTGRISALPASAGQLSNRSINQVYEDSRGLIWIGTRDGLNLYNPKSGKMQELASPPGDMRLFIAGIVEDHNKNMWITTSNGVLNVVLSYDTKSDLYAANYYLYNAKDGLQNCEFNLRSLKCLSTGEVAMGGMYGVNRCRPDNIKYNRTPPHVMFTGFQLFNEEVKIGHEYDGNILLEESLNAIRHITLEHRQNVFTVQFASDNYVLPEKIQYQYKLEGFDKQWMTASGGIVPQATYTNLTPGSYVLKVRAVNSDGYGGADESVLSIDIRPPFWLTSWAFFVYLLLLAMVLLLARNDVLRRERHKYKRRQLEQEAQKNEEINQMKFRFFTNVSHELRTPLTLILSPLEGMIKATTDPGKLEQLNLMHRNALRLLNLVNQLLDFRKSEMAGLTLNLSEGEVVSYLQNICNSFVALSEKRKVHLTFFSSIASLNIMFDDDKLGKVLMNLLSNAFKFTPEDGRVDVSLELLQGDDRQLEIKVSDSGVGISDADKEHIFERFYQSKRESESNLSTGSGIGLSLVYDYVTLHGGTVRVTDNVGTGSVFIVDIPVIPAETSAVPVNEEAVVPTGGKRELSSTKPVALVVDDNEDFVAFMRYSLSLYFRVESASNGKKAWQRIPQLMPDIIVSDLMMPEMDGNELCRRVKSDKQTEGIPFMLLTARQSVETKLEGLTSGADDYVTKPFNVEVLVLRMRKLIALSGKDRSHSRINPEPSDIVITSLDEKLVENAIKYVEQHISDPELSVVELGQELGMSRIHLYKKLLHITGKTPTEFIRVIRLKRAAQLLRESQLNVSEIAYQVGYNSPKYFSKYFKEEFGVLPSVYQEEQGV